MLEARVADDDNFAVACGMHVGLSSAPAGAATLVEAVLGPEVACAAVADDHRHVALLDRDETLPSARICAARTIVSIPSSGPWPCRCVAAACCGLMTSLTRTGTIVQLLIISSNWFQEGTIQQ